MLVPGDGIDFLTLCLGLSVLYSCMPVQMCVVVHVGVHVCGGPRLTEGGFLNHAPCYPLKQGLSIESRAY